MDNKVLLYIIGNGIQYPEINHNGKECKKECVYICKKIYICKEYTYVKKNVCIYMYIYIYI